MANSSVVMLSELNTNNAAHVAVKVRVLECLSDTVQVRSGKKKGTTMQKFTCYLIDKEGNYMFAEAMNEQATRMSKHFVRRWGGGGSCKS